MILFISLFVVISFPISLLGFKNGFTTFNELKTHRKLSLVSKNNEVFALPKLDTDFKIFQIEAHASKQSHDINCGIEVSVDPLPIGHIEKLKNKIISQKIEIGIILDDKSLKRPTVKSSFKDKNRTQYLNARILLLCSAALYGTNFTYIKILNENIPVHAGTALRFTLAAIATLPWLFKCSDDDNVIKESLIIPPLGNVISEEYMGAILGGIDVGLWNSVGYISQAISLETALASTSAFVCSLAVVVVPILDFILGKRLSSREIIGAILSVVGVSLLELDGLEMGFDKTLKLGSDGILSLLQPLAFGVGFWRMEHFMRKYPTNARAMTASQLSTIAFFSIMYFFSTNISNGHPAFTNLAHYFNDPSIIFSVLWTSLITTALTIYMETLALKTLSAAETTMLFLTEPIFGAVCASTVLGESFGFGGFTGASMILLGCLHCCSTKSDDLIAEQEV